MSKTILLALYFLSHSLNASDISSSNNSGDLYEPCSLENNFQESSNIFFSSSESQISAEEEESNRYPYGYLSANGISMLERAYKQYDNSYFTRKTKESSRHTAQQMSAAQPKKHHERRKRTEHRKINPFEVTTPDLLGHHQLDKKTNFHPVPVHGKKDTKSAFHGEASKRESAFEKGQIRQDQQHPSSNGKMETLKLASMIITGQLR